MNFKELLERYKDGTATDEEKATVEKELEKHACIEDYYTEQLPDDFLEKGEYPDETIENADETKDIKKVVNRRLAKVVLTSVLLVVLLYVGIFHGLSAVVDQFYYDPTAVTQSEREEYPDFFYDMTAYVGLNRPGYVVSSYTFQESQGFGTYEVSYPLKNLFTSATQRYFIDMRRGELTYAFDGIFGDGNRFDVWKGFEDILRPTPEDASDEAQEMDEWSTQRQNETTQDYINELNDLTYISMSILFEDDLTMSELYSLVDAYPELDIVWAGVRTTEPKTRWSDNHPMHLIGFNPNTDDEPISNMSPDTGQYPLFMLHDIWEEFHDPEIMFPDAYGTHFKSRLSWLIDREEFVEIIDYNPHKTEFYKDSLKYVEEHGVETYGVRVYGTAEAFSEYIDEIPYESLYVNEVSSAKPNIYYD